MYRAYERTHTGHPKKVADFLDKFLTLLGTLRSEDDDGSENVKKMNSRSSSLHRVYSSALTLSIVGELSCS